MVLTIRRERASIGEPTKVYDNERDFCVAMDRRFEAMHETFKSLAALAESVAQLTSRIEALEEGWRKHDARMKAAEDRQKEDRTRLFNLATKDDCA